MKYKMNEGNEIKYGLKCSCNTIRNVKHRIWYEIVWNEKLKFKTRKGKKLNEVGYGMRWNGNKSDKENIKEEYELQHRKENGVK